MNVRPSIARTNLLSTTQPKFYHYESASNSSEELIEVTELHKSISNISFDSFLLVNSQRSSKANFLLNAPSTSYTSIFVNEENFIEFPKDDKNSNCEDLDVLNIGFTRNQMKKRLDNLVKRAMKFFKGDAEVEILWNLTQKKILKNFLPKDLVPATENGKYALRYRADWRTQILHNNYAMHWYSNYAAPVDKILIQWKHYKTPFQLVAWLFSTLL